MVHIACSDALDIVIDLHESKTHAIDDADCTGVCRFDSYVMLILFV